MSSMSIWIGFDSREVDGFAVTRSSIKRRLNMPIPVRGIALFDLRSKGLYTRPIEQRDGRLWDAISEAPMATEFAISRFATPLLAGGGLALFCDADMLALADFSEVFSLIDLTKAVTVVKHDMGNVSGTKMDGQAQVAYPRKGWSAFCVYNCAHPSNRALTWDLINSTPGRDLHRFCWLKDDEIGELPVEWNWLVGHSAPVERPKNIHFTDGIPSMRGYADAPYANEWRAELLRWAA